jgi:NAD dependent epimerase/dehydratase family enzyme
MRHFSKLLAGGLHRPLIGRIPACVLKRLLGDLSSLFLFSQKALPTRLQASRFEFRYVHLDEAFKQLLDH